MADQFENPEEIMVEDEIELVAEKAAEKSSHTEQSYDQESNDLFKVK